MPFDSARIQICKEALETTGQAVKLGNCYIQMAQNLLGVVDKAKFLFRLDVHFNIVEK